MKETVYKEYLLTVLLVILAFNSVDRLALGLVLQDIKVDLGLSDTHLGFLSGIAFALFYSVMGIPIARWADRGDRVAIIGISTAIWSAAVTLCGAAGNFLQLLLIRTGVAVGQAGCVPPAHSLIADSFARAERPRAVARYMLGEPLSVIIGYFLAGWLNEFYGWRVTFSLLGLPGLALAALAWFTLREPRRGEPRDKVRSAATAVRSLPEATSSLPPQASIREVCVTLWANKSFRHVLLGYAVIAFFSAGISQWRPTFFIRSHGLETGELGTWLAVVYGLGAFLGTYWGGELASRYAANNERLQLQAMGVVFAGSGLISSFIYVSSSHYLAFGLMGLTTVVGSTTSGPLFATIQTLVLPQMRAMSIAIVYFFSGLIGLGLGPLAAGALSDALRPMLGQESLRYALLALSPGYLWGGWHLWRASKTVTTDVETLQADGNGSYPSR